MSVLDYVDKELTIVEWDAKNGFAGYYPDDDGNPVPVTPPPADFQRHQSPEPIKIIIKTIVANELYSLEVVGAGDPGPDPTWDSAAKRLCYIPVSDSMLGVDRGYAVSLREGSLAGGEVTFSFIVNNPPPPNPGTPTTLIGHVRV